MTRAAPEYDMVVIGGGAAGLTAAGMSALTGAKTMLVEANRLGGDCTWSGCVPSKTLLRAAKLAQQTRTADRYGLEPIEPKIDFARVMEHVHAVRRHIYDASDAPPNMEKLGVEVVAGQASFQDAHSVQVAEPGDRSRRVTSRFFVIATGSRPSTPRFDVPVLTNESIFDLTKLPQRLIVMGAGPVGIEMAQAFRRLGAHVTIVATTSRILPKDDAEAAGVLRESLQAEGVRFRFGRKATGAAPSGDHLEITLDNGERVAGDAVLAAIGRQPNIEDLKLENAGVKSGAKGIAVDAHCRTSARHIYASGDVTGRYQFTHMAEHMSKVAVTNAILRLPRSLDEAGVVWCTFTDPELARLGKSEDDLKLQGAQYLVFRFPFQRLDRAITDAETTGLIKVFADRRGRILGATILGANAGEMISEWALAMRHGLSLAKIAGTIHPYPTYLLGNRRAADQWYARQLKSPLLGVLGKVLGYRGQRKSAGEI